MSQRIFMVTRGSINCGEERTHLMVPLSQTLVPDHVRLVCQRCLTVTDLDGNILRVPSKQAGS